MKVVGMSVNFQIQLILRNWELKNDERFSLEFSGQSYTLLS